MGDDSIWIEEFPPKCITWKSQFTFLVACEVLYSLMLGEFKYLKIEHWMQCLAIVLLVLSFCIYICPPWDANKAKVEFMFISQIVLIEGYSLLFELCPTSVYLYENSFRAEHNFLIENEAFDQIHIRWNGVYCNFVFPYVELR